MAIDPTVRHDALAASVTTPMPSATVPGSESAPADALKTVEPTQDEGHKSWLDSLTWTKRVEKLKIPGYKLIRELGIGTYGTVWLAKHEQVQDRKVAIKFLSKRYSDRAEMMLEEVKQLTMLEGAFGIVQLNDLYPDADPPYFIMTYAPGGSLVDLLAKSPGRTLPIAKALPLFSEVVRAMAFVHAKGICHCDLKPGNVLIDANGRPLVADFGQAHLASDMKLGLGTFFYMAPEQASLKAQLSHAGWDVYALGAIFHTMVAGSPPHADETLRRELNDTAELDHRLKRYREYVESRGRPSLRKRVPGIDRGLAAIVDRCLDPDPAKRYSSAAALLEELDDRRQRRKRQKLRLFGLTTALLSLVLMLTISVGVFRSIAVKAESAITEKVLPHEEATAKFMAGYVEDNLREHFDVLTKFTGDAQTRRELLAELVPGRGIEYGSRELVEEPESPLGKKLRAIVDAKTKNSFSIIRLVDAQGWQLYRLEREKRTSKAELDDVAKRRWAWRDYFNGTGDKPGEQSASHKPVSDIHVSQPYKSVVKEVGNLVDISVPVKDDQGNVVGLLVGCIPVSEIQRWFQVELFDKFDSYPVLVDHRGYVIVHDKDHAEDVVSGGWAAQPHPAYLALGESELPDARRQNRHFRDPIDGGEHMIGYAPFAPFPDRPEKQWLAIVGQKREDALAPVSDIKKSLAAFGAGMIGLWGVVVVAAGWWLNRLARGLNRSEHGDS